VLHGYDFVINSVKQCLVVKNMYMPCSVTSDTTIIQNISNNTPKCLPGMHDAKAQAGNTTENTTTS
jgi:hypothetical protein